MMLLPNSLSSLLPLLPAKEESKLEREGKEGKEEGENQYQCYSLRSLARSPLSFFLYLYLPSLLPLQHQSICVAPLAGGEENECEW